ncbi:MAG TPA: PolC-type DNA polymerase III [Thermotogota bacterium]|nr:PolC-type DNA polymerase III [Thermotogota bacterium]
MLLEAKDIQISTHTLLERLGLRELGLNAVIRDFSLHCKDQTVSGQMMIDYSEMVDPDSVKILQKALEKYFGCNIRLSLKNERLNPAQETVLRWKTILRILNGSFSYVTDKVYIKAITEEKICCYVPNEFILRKIKQNRKKLTDTIADEIGFDVKVDFELDESRGKETMEAAHPQFDMDAMYEMMAETEIQAQAQNQMDEKPKRRFFKSSFTKRAEPKERPPVGETVTPIYQMVFNKSEFTIEGEVFSVDYREGPKVATFGIYDGTDSVRCIAFRENAEWIGANLKDGKYAKAIGKATVDNRSDKPSFFIDNIEAGTPKEKRMDNAEEKRIELHAHTQISAMDSIMQIGDFIDTAARWGWEAIAITDHGVVQSFPDLYERCIKNHIRPIFGMEGYLVDVAPIVYNKEFLDEVKTDAIHEKITAMDYVVFDFETTGLSPLNDEIIEFGAVKVVNGEVTETFSELVDPGRPISEKISEITGITNEMLKGQPKIDEVLPRFMEFIAGTVLVAHNANFDYRFLKQQALKVLGLDYNNAYVDTLSLSRSLLNMKSNSLDKVVKALGLDDFNHHRAFEDAKITADVFLKLAEIATNRGKDTLEGLDSLKSEMDLTKLFGRDFTVYVRNKTGLRNLYKLVTESHLNYFGRAVPLIPKDILTKNREGLIIGTGSPMSELANGYRFGYDNDELKELAQFYDFIEIMPPDAYTAVEEDLDYDRMYKMYKKFYELSQEIGLPCIMTGNVHYLDRENKKPWSIMKISEKALRRRGKQFPSGMFDAVNLHLRTTDEMLEIAEKITGSFEEAKALVIDNPKKLIANFEDIKPITRQLHPPEMDGAEEEVREIAYKKMYEIYGENPLPEVKKRLDFELDAIIGNGYSVLYLIAQRIVNKSMEDGYLVGSRGSVGSSFAATMLGITEVNPLSPHYVCPECKHTEFSEDKSVSSGYDLPEKDCPECGAQMRRLGQEIPFETFMGFNGNKVPDIDLNFSGEYQTRAHRYIEELFGRDHVFKAGTISTVADKTAYGYVLRYEECTDENIKDIEKERISKVIAGVKRTTGQHPGGLMIVPKSMNVYEFTPVQHPANDRNSEVRTTHFDYHSIHDDLVKIDALGHDDPTFMRYLQDITGINPLDVPMGDEKTVQIFSSPDPLGLKPDDIPGVVNGSLGIPEFGTNFVRGMLMDTKPRSFADLVRISGLSHGTGVWLDNANMLIKNKTAVLSEVIACRDDIMNLLIHSGVEHVKAFQIMEIVRKGKDLKEEDVELMKEHGIQDWFIKSCEAIKYLFPKAHAVAYVSMAFRVAYFKVHHPLAYYSTYFTVKGGEFDVNLILSGPQKIRQWLDDPEAFGSMSKQKLNSARVVNEIALEMLLRGYEFLPVSIKKSDINRFTIEDGKLRIPLNRVSGLGDRAAESVVIEREKEPFISIDDFNRRTACSTSIIEVLKEMKAFDGLQEHAQYSLFGG